MYFAMFYLCFFSLEETSDIPIVGVLAAFVMGGISIIFIQGGIGVYPAAIMEVLFLYEIIKPMGLALGWIIWISQTAMLIVMGVLSLLLISRYNKSIKINKTLFSISMMDFKPSRKPWIRDFILMAKGFVEFFK